MFKALIIPQRQDVSETLRLPWNKATQKAFNGRWCALAECVYDNDGEAQQATLIDQDDDLAALCDRIRFSEHKCDIVFCNNR